MMLGTAPLKLTGATFTWDATPDNGNWNNSSNWDTLPVANTNETALIFGASSVSQLNLDFAAPFQLNALTFSSAAPALTLSNGTLRFGIRQDGFYPSP